jgi:hypothetical protein
MLGADSTSWPGFIIYRGTATITPRSAQGPLPHLVPWLAAHIAVFAAASCSRKILMICSSVNRIGLMSIASEVTDTTHFWSYCSLKMVRQPPPCCYLIFIVFQAVHLILRIRTQSLKIDGFGLAVLNRLQGNSCCCVLISPGANTRHMISRHARLSLSCNAIRITFGSQRIVLKKTRPSSNRRGRLG